MVKPSVVIVWPRAFDYPLFRDFLARNRSLFGQVIISFTDNSVERDVRKFLKWAHPDFTFVSQIAVKSWYNEAVNSALEMVTGEWVLFLEQDFICTDEFLKLLLENAEKYDFVCHAEGKRLHLACMITKMASINKTHRFFDQMPRYNMDCFGLFFAEMEVLFENGATLDKIFDTGYTHLNGLTHNFYLALHGQIKNVVNPNAFETYLRVGKNTNVVKHQEWEALTDKILTHYD